MLRKPIPLAAAIVLIVASATLPTPLTAQQHDDETEHSFRFDVVTGGPPAVWSYRTGGFLGILMLELTPELRLHFGVSEDAGVMISSVGEDSPAAEAGLQVGDIITSVDGEPVADSRGVVRAISSHEGGEAATLELFRDGSYTTVTATLGERERTQFWLNTLGGPGPGRLRIMGEEGESVFVLPRPDSEAMHLKQEAVNEVMENLQERLASPEFQGQMMEFRSNTAHLEERIRELEARLEALTKQLESLAD